MQTRPPPTLFDPSHRGPSYLPARPAVPPAPSSRSLAAVYTEHCAPAADAAFPERAMQSLSLPPPSSLPSTPFGRRQETGSSLAKRPHPQLSASRSEQYSYPSPPMSDSHSPARRSVHVVEPDGHRYAAAPAVSDPRRVEGIAPPPPPALLDPRSAAAAPQPASHRQRPLYPGDHPAQGQQPLHYQPGRAVDSASYGGMQLAHNYSYSYPGHGVASYLGGQGAGPQAQPTAMIPPPPLMPSKPARRTKAHVASACVNCKKAHLSCDVQRPCGRCVASGKQDTCKDVQHKKRGRPRLRDDKEFGRGDDGRAGPAQLQGTLPPSNTESFAQQSTFPASHHISDPFRTPGRSMRAEENASLVGIRPTSVGSHGGVPSSSSYPAGPNLAYQSLPVAFLNLDLVIQKSNRAFQDLVSFLGDVRGKDLSHLLEGRQAETLHRLRNNLRNEKDEREPTYMAPITPVGQDPMQSVMQSINDQDVDQVSQGYSDRPSLLNFRLPNGQYQSLQCQIRLAKTSLYFVTLVVRTPPRMAGPPLLTQQLAPPTPVRASQTLSAPTTAPPREYAQYPPRPSSATSSASTSPYFNFASVRTSLPTINSSSYGSSPSYGYSPTTGPERGYFSQVRPPPQPGPISSPYPTTSRPGSMTSDSLRELNRPARMEGLQLPPIRTTQVPPLGSPMGQEFGESARELERVRPHGTPLTAEQQGPETPDTGKRRRLNIQSVLE